MKILVLNCGGSSLKYQFIDMSTELVLAKGSIDRLGTDQAVFRHKGRTSATVEAPVPTFAEGIEICVRHLEADGLIQSAADVSLVAHKLAHGGERFRQATLISDAVLDEMRKLSTLAPVHNPPSIRGIEQCRSILPGVPQAGVFETTFHSTVPDYAFTYGLPAEWRLQHGVRKYGFHGASHGYVSARLAQLTGRDDLKVASCHLGSGTSVAAIVGGKSVDISSGLTPQSGTIMSTRPGDFDPWVFPYVMETLGLSAEEANQQMVRKGGLLGISGVSGDMRDLEEAAAAGHEGAALAFRVFCYQVLKYIGAFAAAMGGLDTVVFTGGIGENSPNVRRQVCAGLGFLGLELDLAANLGPGPASGEFLVSTHASRASAYVIPTNEELMVARQAAKLL